MTTQALNPSLPNEAARNDTGQGGAPPTAGRDAGAVLVACAAASVLLLMNHPEGGASHTLADVLRQEASHALSDAIVHGGFIVVLAVELVCFAVLATRLGARRPAVLAAMVFALVGAGLLSASMILDGLVTPAVATRYLAAPPERQEAARGLLVLIGAAINALMPLGLAFLGAAALAWSAVLIPTPARRARIAGGAGLILGLAALVGAALSPASATPIPLMAALLASAAWALAAGIFMTNGRDVPVSPGLSQFPGHCPPVAM